MIEEIVYLDRDNAATQQLRDNTSGLMANADLSTTTRIDVHYGEEVLSSATHPTLITWTSGGVVTIKLGSLDLTPGRYPAYYVLYDPINTNGVRWRKGFTLEIAEV